LYQARYGVVYRLIAMATPDGMAIGEMEEELRRLYWVSNGVLFCAM